MERRNAVTRARLRLHPPDEPSRGSSCGHGQGPLCAGPAFARLDAADRRVVLRSRLRTGAACSRSCSRRMRLPARTSGTVWTSGFTTRGPEGRSEAGRSSSGVGFPAVRYVRAQPALLGAAPAYLDRLVFRFCRAAACRRRKRWWRRSRTGSVDLAYAVRDISIAPVLRAIPGVRVFAGPTTGWENLTLRRGPGGHPALRRKGVRQALVYGLDRVALVRELFGVIDPRYSPSDSALVLNTSRSYVPNWRRYTYRPALAQRLLEQEGCRRGADGIYECDGRRLSLQFWTPAGATLRARSLGLIQDQLRRIGVEVVPQFALAPALFGEIMPSGAFDGVHLAYFSAVDGPVGGKWLYGCGGPGNTMGYCQRLVTRDLDQLELILDPAARARLANRVDVQLANDVPVIPLYQLPFLTAHRQELRNVALSGDPFWNAEDWWLAR